MSSRLSCTTCMFYVAATRSCQATGAYVPKLPADHWRSCPRFALSREHDTVANRRIVARRDVVNAARAANAAEEQAKKTLEEHGVTIIEPDMESFRALVVPAMEGSLPGVSEGVYERMAAALETIRK